MNIKHTRKSSHYKLVRNIRQSPNKAIGIPLLFLEGRWMTSELGLNVGDTIELTREQNGHITIKKV